MKKTLLTIAIILTMTLSVSAQWGGGLFQRGAVSDEDFYGAAYGYQDRTDGLLLPGAHGDANDQQAPLGGGALLLIGFGAAYMGLRKKNRKS